MTWKPGDNLKKIKERKKDSINTDIDTVDNALKEVIDALNRFERKTVNAGLYSQIEMEANYFYEDMIKKTLDFQQKMYSGTTG